MLCSSHQQRVSSWTSLLHFKPLNPVINTFYIIYISRTSSVQFILNQFYVVQHKWILFLANSQTFILLVRSWASSMKFKQTDFILHQFHAVHWHLHCPINASECKLASTPIYICNISLNLPAASHFTYRRISFCSYNKQLMYKNSHHGDLDSIPNRVMEDVRWTNWHWGMFLSVHFAPANYHSSNCSIFINHPITEAISILTA